MILKPIETVVQGIAAAAVKIPNNQHGYEETSMQIENTQHDCHKTATSTSMTCLQLLEGLMCQTLDPTMFRAEDKLQRVTLVHLYQEPVVGGAATQQSSYRQEILELKKRLEPAIERVGCDYLGHEGFQLANQVTCLFYNKTQPATSTVPCSSHHPVVNLRFFPLQCTGTMRKEYSDAVREMQLRPVVPLVLPLLRHNVYVDSAEIKIRIQVERDEGQTNGFYDKSVAKHLLGDVQTDLALEVSRAPSQ